MRRAIVWFLTGCVVTLVVVGVLSGSASQALVKVQPLDLASWLRGFGGWLAANKDPVTSTAAGIGIVIAILALLVNARSGQQTAMATRTTAWNSTRDLLWRYNEYWAQLYESRMKAEQILKTMPPAPYVYDRELAEILNYFEGMAFFGNRGRLDDDMAWQYYFDDAADLWNRAIGYVKWRREAKRDWTLYSEYEKWVHRLARIDARRREVAERKRRDPSLVETSVKASIPAATDASQEVASKDRS